MLLSSTSESYIRELEDIVGRALRDEAAAIAAAGSLIADRFALDGLLHIFGSGHSHIFAEEAFYRAGGSARISPILQPQYMLHAGAERSTTLERESGHAAEILAHYTLNPKTDVMLVVSNSGANALPIEMAQTASERGLPVTAVTSVSYASASSKPGPRLHEIADIVIDNHCPPGDALVELGKGLPRVGPASSVVGLALLNALLVDAIAKHSQTSPQPEVFISAGMPDVSERNRALATRFRGRIPHL